MTNEKPAKLGRDDFIQVVRNAPLVSIDLIVKNSRNEILVGLRKNEPAKDYWFVPGGRVLKDEHIRQAFERITKEELGIEIPYEQAGFFGVFEHLHQNNFTQKDDFTTHYIVLAHLIHISESPLALPQTQHREYKWLSKESASEENNVHPYTLAYFK